MELAVQVSAETKASKASKLTLPKAVSVTMGFRLILSNTLDHIRANIPAARDGDPEGIHQLRIGIRRTRAVLKLFQKQLSRNLTRRFDRRLRHYGQLFGEERNWDVFIAAMPNEDACHQRQRAHERVAAELDRSQFRNLVERLDTWGRSIEIGSRRLDKMLPELLDRRRKKLLAQQRKAKLSQPASVHRVRKALKHLRYSSEFAAGLYRKKSVKRYLRPIQCASDWLGDMNDAATCAAMMGKLDLDEATQRTLQSRVERRLRQARRHVPKAFKKLHAKPFW